MTDPPRQFPLCEGCRMNPGLCEQIFPEHLWLCPYCMEELFHHDYIMATYGDWGKLD